MMGYKEFRLKTINRNRDNKKKVMKVSNSWGNYDAYKYIRKHKWEGIGHPISEHDFYTIIRKVNDLLAEELALGHTIYFPYNMGKLEVRKEKRGVRIKNGKLKITYPIDWNSTLRLWFEDEEAYKKKTLIRFESGIMYRVRYCKFHTNYVNQGYYCFTLNRFVQQALKENVNSNKIETLW